MKESVHIRANEVKWDKWAESIDSESWKYEFLRRSQRGVVSLLDLKPGMSLLDIGCGTGWALGYAAQMVNGDATFYGVDLSTKMIEKAKENFKEHPNFHFITSNSESIPLDDSLFNYIICTNSFHHYLHPDKAVNEMKRLLKPGGKTYILDPTADTRIVKFANRIIKLIERAHVNLYSTKEFEQMITNAGLNYAGSKTIERQERVHIGKK